MLSFVEFKKNAREIMEEYLEKADFFRSTAKDAKLKNLEPNQTVPGDNVLKAFTPEDAKLFEENIKPLKERGILLLTDYLERVQKVKTEAPTTEAVNYVSMLKLKKNISDADINDALAVYGNNYIVFDAIEAIANDNDIYIGENPLDGIEETLENFYNNTIKRMSAKDAEKITAGSIEFSLMMLENSLPDEI